MQTLGDAPFRRIQHHGLTVEGYSRAAMQTYWRVPEPGVGFDLGGHPLEFLDTPTWFISHCHLDHIAALPVYIWRRRMANMPPPRVLLPRQHVDDVRKLLAACGKLGRDRIDCELVGLAPGDEIDLSPKHLVTVFATRHTVPSLGFVVWQRSSLTVSPDDVSSMPACDVSRSEREASDEARVPLICYTGDTAPEGLDANPVVFDAMILITEMTFVDPRHRRDLIWKHGHLHLDDFVSRAERFHNGVIIASHVTARSSPAQVNRFVSRSLPDSLRGRLHVWM